MPPGDASVDRADAIGMRIGQGLENERIQERKNCGVRDDRQRERDHHRRGESRIPPELPGGELEILLEIPHGRPPGSLHWQISEENTRVRCKRLHDSLVNASAYKKAVDLQ